LPVFDARIKGLPLEESGSLRYYRKVIGEKFCDFQARLPDRGPPPLYALGMLEDGTTEDSKYPNLMSPEGREKYGI